MPNEEYARLRDLDQDEYGTAIPLLVNIDERGSRDPWAAADFGRALADDGTKAVLAIKGKLVLGYMLYQEEGRNINLIKLEAVPGHEPDIVRKQLYQELADKINSGRKDRLVVHVHEEDNDTQVMLRDALKFAINRAKPIDKEFFKNKGIAYVMRYDWSQAMEREGYSRKVDWAEDPHAAAQMLSLLLNASSRLLDPDEPLPQDPRFRSHAGNFLAARSRTETGQMLRLPLEAMDAITGSPSELRGEDDRIAAFLRDFGFKFEHFNTGFEYARTQATAKPYGLNEGAAVTVTAIVDFKVFHEKLMALLRSMADASVAAETFFYDSVDAYRTEMKEPASPVAQMTKSLIDNLQLSKRECTQLIESACDEGNEHKNLELAGYVREYLRNIEKGGQTRERG